MHTLFAGAVWTFQAFYTLALYLGTAIPLYTIAKNNGLPYAWIAFIPIVQYALIGMLCEEYILLGVRIRPLSVVMVGLGLLQAGLPFHGGLICFLLQLAVNLLIALILHKFFYLFEPQRALVYALLSFLGRLPMVIVLFLIKDKPMCMSAGAYPYPFAQKR